VTKALGSAASPLCPPLVHSIPDYSQTCLVPPPLRRQRGRTLNLKFTGLAQNLRQLFVSYIVIFSQTAGSTCEFWLNPVQFSCRCWSGSCSCSAGSASATAARTSPSRGGWAGAWYVPPRTRFIPYSLTYSVPLFLKRQCDRTLGGGRATGATAGQPRARSHYSKGKRYSAGAVCL
jgi:hypothetical protein